MGAIFLTASITITAVVFGFAHHETQLRLKAQQDVNEAINALLESDRYGFAILDEDGNIVEWNPAMEELTGWTKTDVIKAGMRPLMNDDELYNRHHQATLKAFERAKQGDLYSEPGDKVKVNVVECEVPGKNGAKSIPVRITVRIVKAKSGRFYSVAHADTRQSVHIINPQVKR
jgi:PAS domain S-box-containing protein